MKLHELFENVLDFSSALKRKQDAEKKKKEDDKPSLEKTQERLRKLGYPEKKKGPFGLGPKTPVKESAGAPGISDEDMKLLKTAAKIHGDAVREKEKKGEYSHGRVTHEEEWKGKYSHFELDGYGWNPLTYKKNATELAKMVGLPGDLSNSTPREITLAAISHKNKKGSK